MLLDSQSLFEAHPANEKFITESRTKAKRQTPLYNIRLKNI